MQHAPLKSGAPPPRTTMNGVEAGAGCLLDRRHAPKASAGGLERGITAGEAAIRLGPDRPEGHYWLAADMGALAESFGLSRD